MDSPQGFIVSSAITALRDFLTRPGARHAFLVGPPGVGKTSALYYLALTLRSENSLVAIVPLGAIESGDQLIAQIARTLLDQTAARAKPLDSDPLEIIRTQFEEQFTAPQIGLRGGADLLEDIIQILIERMDLKPRAYIFLDGLDEVSRAGDVVVAVENLAERLQSANMVVTSRQSYVLDHLSSRTAFDTFTLGSLTAHESTEFIRRLFPEWQVAEPLSKELISRSRGNPLLLNLFANYLREQGDLGRLEGADTIQALLDRLYDQRLGSDQAGTDARLLLSLLYFLQPVSSKYLTEASGLPAARARTALERLSGSMIISSSDRQMTFAHATLAEYHLENNLITHDIAIAGLQFGDEAAERDRLLKESFMPPHDLKAVASGVKTIVLGDRGAGKSAMFRALQDLSNVVTTDAAQHCTIISVSQDPASFVQQMAADDSVKSTADGFKAIWLLYSAALAVRDLKAPADSADENTRAFVKASRTLLRSIGWGAIIKGESRLSRWMAALRAVTPEKVSLKLGPITVEPNLNRRGRNWFGSDFKIDAFIDCTDRFLQATDSRLLIVFDQIDDVFKYQRDRQEALVQGLFLAESFLSLRQAIRLVVLLRTDLFELYDIQEKNKFVSRTVRLDWSHEQLRKLLLRRLFSNADLRSVIETVNCPALEAGLLSQIQLRIAFPVEVERRPFEEWLFESLKNGQNHVAPRQIILFLNLTRDNVRDDVKRRRVPLFSEKEVADAMTRLSELSYQEVISDFRAATSFVRNCRAGKIVEFKLEDVKTLFDENEGPAVLQLERLQRLGFLARTIIKHGDVLVPRFRIPRLFTRCWETSD